MRRVEYEEEERLPVSGKVRVEFRSVETGEVVEVRESTNLVVNAGISQLANVLIGANVKSDLYYIGASSDTTTVAATDTSVPSLIGTLPAATRYTSGSPVTTANIVVFASGSQLNGTWNKLALYYSDNSTLFAEVNITTFSKTSAYSATITWSVTV
jgi:hypothetical protein